MTSFGMEQAVDPVLDALYAGVSDGTRWSAAMVALADLVGGSGTVLLSHDAQAHRLLRDEAYRFDASLVRRYRDGWDGLDPRVAAGIPLPLDEPQYESRVLGLAAWRRSPVFNDFLVPNDIPYSLTCYLHRQPERATVLTIQSTRRRGPFDAMDAGRIARYLPHLRRALGLRDRLEEAAERARVAGWLSDQLPFGVILLDASGRVLEMNHSARVHLDPATVWIAADCQLMLPDTARAALRATLSLGLSQQERRVHTDGYIPIPRAGRVALQMCLVPHASLGNPLGCAASWLVLLHDPEQPVQLDPEWLISCSALSRREAELTCVLLNGRSLQAAAAGLGVSLETARTYLKSVFAKLGVHSQAELVRAVLHIVEQHAPPCGGFRTPDR